MRENQRYRLWWSEYFMGKEVKTNAMRILDKNKIPYEIINYECDEFIDGLHTAEAPELRWSSLLKHLSCREKVNNIMFLYCRSQRKLI